MFSLNSVNILLQMPIYCQQFSVFLSNKSKFKNRICILWNDRFPVRILLRHLIPGKFPAGNTAGDTDRQSAVQ